MMREGCTGILLFDAKTQLFILFSVQHHAKVLFQPTSVRQKMPISAENTFIDKIKTLDVATTIILKTLKYARMTHQQGKGNQMQ